MSKSLKKPYKKVSAEDVIDHKLQKHIAPDTIHDDISQDKERANNKVEKRILNDIGRTPSEKEFFRKFPPTKKKLKYLLLSKESQQEMIEKKRQVLMTQLVIDSKHKEIEKYKRQLEKRLSYLDQVETTLEKNALEFDHNLKEQDRLVQSAQRDAEKETKNKQTLFEQLRTEKEKILHINAAVRKLNVEIEDISRYDLFLKKVVQESKQDSEKKLVLPEEIIDIFSRIEEDTLFRLTTKQNFHETYTVLVKESKHAAHAYQGQIDFLRKKIKDLTKLLKVDSVSPFKWIKDLRNDLLLGFSLLHGSMMLALENIPSKGQETKKPKMSTTQQVNIFEKSCMELISKFLQFNKKERVFKEKQFERIRRNQERDLDACRRKRILEDKIDAKNKRIEEFERRKKLTGKVILSKRLIGLQVYKENDHKNSGEGRKEDNFLSIQEVDNLLSVDNKD